MDIVVDKVYDKQRFAWFIHLRYKIPLSYAKNRSNYICEKTKHMFTNLSESEVRYLQGPMNDCSHDRPIICSLKIINNMTVARKPTIPPYCDNERKSCIDISPQLGDEPKQEPLNSFHVKFTKVIHYDEMLNERQIQALLKDKHVKSINIEKQ